MPQRPSTRFSYEQRINAVLDMIMGNLSSPLDLQELARAACLSPFHLHRVFTAMMGETPGACLRRIRLQTAAYMLQFQPGRSVTDIAHACGFSSSQNFARAFRGWSGVSPGIFRRGCRDNTAPSLLAQKRKEGNAAPYLLEYCDANGILKSRITRNPAVEARGAVMNVVVRTEPERHVAYARHIGPYGAELGETWERIMRWAGTRGLLHPGVEVLGISWDNPELTPPERCRYDACVTVPKGTPTDDGICAQIVAGGLYACYRRPTRLHEFVTAMNELFGIWLPESGYECCGGPFELYHDALNDGGGALEDRVWDVSFCLPVKAGAAS